MNSLADFQDAEKIVDPQQGAMRDAVKMNIPAGLKKRRLYAYMSAVRNDNTKWYRLNGKVIFRKQGNPVAELPAIIANHDANEPALNESTVCMFNAGGNPVENSIAVTIANPFGVDPNQVVLQPMTITADADELVFDMEGYEGGSPLLRWRVYLACLSTAE